MNTILEKISRRAFLGSGTVVVAALTSAGKPALRGDGRSEEDLQLRRILSRYGKELGK